MNLSRMGKYFIHTLCHSFEGTLSGHTIFRFDYAKSGDNLKYALWSISPAFLLSSMVTKHQFILGIS